MNTIFAEWHGTAIGLGIFAGAIVTGLLANAILFALIRRLGRRGKLLYVSVARHCDRPMRLMLPAIAVEMIVPLLKLSGDQARVLGHALSLALIGGIGWLSMGAIAVAVDEILARYRVDAKDNLAARKIHTQLNLFKRALSIVVGVLTFSVMIMTFSWARDFGTSVLASAGIAGLVVGMAARSTLTNLIAGIQIALTEPIRIDDVVIVDGEWGWIEEILTTYVVVRVWDLRRLVVPISYFIEKPFQNWTRATADLLGYTYVYVDYTAPIEAIRDELRRILEASPRWDRRVWNLQVTNASEHTIELRALMSAADSGTAWDLRCEVREKLVEFIQKSYPQCLPKARGEIGELRARVLAPEAQGADGPPIGHGHGA